MKRVIYLVPVVLIAAVAYFVFGRATLESSEPRAKTHRVVLQVNSDEPATMNLALNNATNVEQYYKSRGEPVQVEVVAFGPGLHMLRDDTSPVKDRLRKMAEAGSTISFKACGNTRENMARRENGNIPLVAQASVVSSGVVHVMELQEQGWSYVRP
ncbi:MAG: DsrE family protein [Alphaproteobacteria bacterium]|nr:DsrE family protein [Alphaproteobacteria bacterium]MBV8406109.1 DsrE family protein [Alphaproteobacteria bacterium]